MRIKHIIIIYGLLVAASLSGCSKTVDSGQAIVGGYETVEAAESGVVIAENVSFSAGEIQSPISTPMITASAEPSAARAPAQTPEKPAAPKQQNTPAATPMTTSTPAATSKPTPKPTKPAQSAIAATFFPIDNDALPIVIIPAPTATQTPTPIATPRPTATPMPTASPAPVPTSTPTATPAPPMVFFTPELQAGRTICNTCGAEITGNIAAHGDGHLLNGENFSYRVE